MRIIAGKLKGHTLLYSKNKTVRPLKDRARESIFNLLMHSNKIPIQFEKLNVLDLYAGTGSFGLECLSRGAKNVCFIENSIDVKKILEKNIRKLQIKKNALIFFGDVLNSIKKKDIFQIKFDLIFCDPPFKDTNVENLIELIFTKNLLNRNGVIILHRNRETREKFPECFKIIDERIYGISKIIFGKFLF